jgi:RNA polymerase sigma-70 factor (ECF subfamily)
VLVAAQAGAPWAWERIYETLAGRVAGYLRVQGAAEPDDTASEVFIAVFRSIQTFSGTEDQFRSWVFVIAHRRLQDERRRARRRDAHSHPAADGSSRGAPDAETDALARLGTDRVRTICEQLVPDQRDVLMLRLLGDMTVDQVADALGKSRGAVKALQRRALEAVRRLTEHEGVPL